MLKRLISRGDQVSIVDGILQIIPASGEPVPNDWYNINNQSLIKEIAKAVSVTAYRYTDYSTGNYKGDRGRLHSGVTLQFVDIATSETSHAIFNTGLKRVQASKCGKYKKGDPLKKKRFTPPKSGAFCQFIERSGLPKPRHISESSEKMGQLKDRIFTMNTGEKNKAINETLITLSVTYTDIVTALNIAVNARAEFGDSSDRDRETTGQNIRAGNDLKHANVRLVEDSSYGTDSLRLKLTSKHGIKDVYIPLTETQHIPNTGSPSKPVRPQEQHIDDWLADYDS